MAHWIEAFDGQLVVCGPLSESQLSRLPARRGVFMLLAEGDRPIVLMTAADVRRRAGGRLAQRQQDQPGRSADLRKITVKILWKQAWSHFETDLLFLRLSRRIWPNRFASLLAFKPAWFVHVDPSRTHPHFVRTRDVFASAGRYLGPFGDGRSADRFIETLQGLFDLCRNYRRLLQSPDAPPCSYGQMGRCLCPCDGSISMAEYRRAVIRAADFAAGGRDEFRRKLMEEMKAASDLLEFERAGGIKSRLDRLGEFDKPACLHVAPAEQFRFVLVQSGAGRRRANVFWVNRGRIAGPWPLDWPLSNRQLTRVLKRMAAHAAEAASPDPEEKWAMGLVAHYLYASERRRGVMLRWREGMTRQDLAEAVAASADQLGLGGRRKADSHPAADNGPTGEDRGGYNRAASRRSPTDKRG